MNRPLATFMAATFLCTAAVQAHSHTVVVQEVYPTQVVVVNAPSPIVVSETPPAPLMEEITPSPGPNYYCIGGYWEWKGKWAWRNHEWVIRPQASTAWEPPHWHWSDHHHGYISEPGHWR